MNSENLFRNTKGLDFKNTKDSPLYEEYWKGPDKLREGGYEPNEKTKNNKFWTVERLWQENGYTQKVRESKALFLENSKLKKLCKNSCIVDLGSGKGHAILSFAIEWCFKKVVGVEINKEYLDISKKNIEKLTSQNPNCHLSEIDLYNIPAENFKFDEGINFIFMFNPFGPKTVRKVYQNIIDSLEAYPREFYILYESANHRSLFLEAGRFKIIYDNIKFFILKSV